MADKTESSLQAWLVCYKCPMGILFFPAMMLWMIILYLPDPNELPGSQGHFFHLVWHLLSDARSMAFPPHLNNRETSHSQDHAQEHVMRLTRNLLVFQEAGLCCDVIMQCKDGVITAHSGEPIWINRIKSKIAFINWIAMMDNRKICTTQRAIMMPITGYSPDFPDQLFSTFGTIPGSFRVQISVLFWETPIQRRLGLTPGLVQQLSAYWKIKSKQ